MSATSLSNTDANAALEALRMLFADEPKVTAQEIKILQAAVDELELDPRFHADYLKGRFVSTIRHIMGESHVSSASLANAWGKTRQYLSKLLNEDKRINFTLETMAELALLLHHRVKIDLIPWDETTTISHSNVRTRGISNFGEIPSHRLATLDSCYDYRLTENGFGAEVPARSVVEYDPELPA